MATHNWSRQNKAVAFEGKGMHMSDTISAAFCDVSEISCRWALRHGLFNSARDCHVPNASVTVSSCLVNKWAQASLGGHNCTVLHWEDFWQGCPPSPLFSMQWTSEYTQGGRRDLPNKGKPNQICITCDVHMMAQNWFVMPEWSSVAVTKALWTHCACSYDWAFIVSLSSKVLQITG